MELVFDLDCDNKNCSTLFNVSLSRFLSWLEEVGKGCQVYMVSHGNNDVLVLHKNFSKVDMEERLYRVINKFVDFQQYLFVYFTYSQSLSLESLANKVCGESFR